MEKKKRAHAAKVFCNLRGLTQRGFNAATPVRRLSPPPPRFISSISAYSLSYLRRGGGYYTTYLPHQTCPLPHLSLPLLPPCFFCQITALSNLNELISPTSLEWLLSSVVTSIGSPAGHCGVRPRPGGHLSICARHCGEGPRPGGPPVDTRHSGHGPRPGCL